MDTLRENPPKEVANIPVIEARDYSTQKIKNVLTNEETDTNLPKSNVLYYVLEDKTWFCVRPSGTEPKIKVYFGSCDNTAKKAEEKVKKASDGVLAIVDEILK